MSATMSTHTMQGHDTSSQVDDFQLGLSEVCTIQVELRVSFFHNMVTSCWCQ